MVAVDLGKTVVVAWTLGSRRPLFLAEHMAARLLVIGNLIGSRGLTWRLFFWVDYLYKTVRNAVFLLAQRPDTVVAQADQSLCPIVSWVYCALFKARLVVDAHNCVFDPPWIRVPFFLNILRRASVVLVHNEELHALLVRRYSGIRFLVLPDRVRRIERAMDGEEEKYMLVVLSYADDEPVEALFEAIRMFGETDPCELHFRATGRYRKRVNLYHKYRTLTNLSFLGFVTDEEYDALLAGAYGIVALTCRDMCQQCAVVEAIGAAVPVLSSNTLTNRRLLPGGGVLVECTKEAIRDGIERLVRDHATLREGIRDVREIREKEWAASFEAFVTAVRGEKGLLDGSGCTVDKHEEAEQKVDIS